MRNCNLKSIKAENFRELTSLEYLDISNNQIVEILPASIPKSLHHIDLSHNVDPTSVIQEGMKIQPAEIFSSIEQLLSVDFSFTKIDAKSIVALKLLPNSVRFVSLCYVELPDFKGKFFENNTNIEMLDISGNPRFNLTSEKFETIENSLQVLYVRNSNVRSLEWTKELRKLKSIDLYDNNIHAITQDSFSHMEELVKLDLERNAIGNWYDKMFSNNQKLDILNLRENKLNRLTNDMKDDFLSVKFLAIGKNEFDCNCEVQDFLHKLFKDTKSANITALKKISQTIEFEDESQKYSLADESQRAVMSARAISPQYDVISRTFKKYYEMAEQSVNALKLRLSKSEVFNKDFVMRSKANDEFDDNYPTTLLFDYDEDDDDYECINANEKEKQPIIEMDLCHEGIKV